MQFWRGFFGVLAVVAALRSHTVAAQTPRGDTVVDIAFTPTKRAQIAIWIEDASGKFMQTVMLTDLVARLGIGNRPGASQMNSGYRWPYGRREGVLPIWGTRRASADGARQFTRVIFQNRFSEGRASRTRNDQSPDPYFCLSFNRMGSDKDSLDAVTCASASFSSDKGRFITQQDVDNGYAEPFEDPATQTGVMAPLSMTSLYPPRRDVERCVAQTCFDHADVTTFRSHALSVMPELDAITTATLPGDVERHQLFTVPRDWPDGDYVAWLEINVEGDYNDTFNDTTFATPTTPAPDVDTGTSAQAQWDSWAIDWGYPYRGQPSVIYRVAFSLGAPDQAEASTDMPVGAGEWDWRAPNFGEMQPLDDITNAPDDAPGSGVDRLRPDDEGARLHVKVKDAVGCEGNQAPSPVSELRTSAYADFRHQHEWARLSFVPAEDDDRVFRYEVRLAESPMVDASSFLSLGAPAKSATSFSQELLVPVDGADQVGVDFGGMTPQTTYYVGVRAIDSCNVPGELAFTTITTTEQQFTTVTPCFVATAAYGSPLAQEIGSLRRLRDRWLAPHTFGRTLIESYYSVGPRAAAVIANHEWLRDLTRNLLSPIVWFAARMDREPS